MFFFTNSVSDHKDCLQCGKSFFGPNAGQNFINHLKKHIPKKTMVCQYCNKDYKKKSELERHLNTCKARKKTCEVINNVKQKVISNEKADKLDINKQMSTSKKQTRLLKCAVPFCKTVGANGFFKFPKDLDRKAEWLRCCGLTGHNATSKDRVCYEHFENWCFVNTIHPNRRQFLRPNAKPEKNLPLL